MLRLSSALSGIAAALALAVAACGGETDSSGLATLVEAVPAAEAVSESENVETAGITTSTSETTKATVAATTAETATTGTTVATITETATTDTTTETTTPTADDADDGDGPPTTTTAQPNPAEPGGDEDLSDEERLLRFADCMRDNGVDFPDPVVQADGTVRFGIRPGAGGATEAEGLGPDLDLSAAAEACADLLQGLSVGGGATTVDITELQDSLLEFARCMRDNGVDMGDPDFGDLGPRGGGNDGPTDGPIVQVWELSGDGPAGVDFGDPDVAAAFETCQAEMNIGRLGLSEPRSGS
ncbi:MAG: hypothetical protein OXG47_00020 [bacterium]|nr:hypothetical protein [bacterium]